MFKIGSQRLTWMAVRWQGLADDGSPVDNEVRCRVHLVDRSELLDERESGPEQTAEWAARVTSDWQDVGDADGQPLGFSAENFALLFEAPGFAGAFIKSYLQAWDGQSGIREKNSATSPADGQAAGGRKAKSAR